MNSRKYAVTMLASCVALAFTASSSLAADKAASAGAADANAPAASRSMTKQTKSATEQLSEATKVVNTMKRDAQLSAQLQQAQGVFVVPDYGRAALGIGARGGQGVLLVKRDGQWSNPAFYRLGGVSLGLQAGVEAGAIAMVLTNQKAVNSFMQTNNWSLNADAGLTLVNWSPKAQGSIGKGDVIVWADTEGLFADASVSVTDINFDKQETAAFYGRQASMQDVFSGRVKAPQAPQVAALKQALPGGATTSSGSSGASDMRRESQQGSGSYSK